MPIHDFSYRHWEGERSERPPALVLGSAQIRVALQRRAVKLLLLVSGLFVIAYLGILYVETMPRDGLLGFLRNIPLVKLDGRTLQIFLDRQRLLHYLICLAAGAEVIALDRRFRTLQIYLARPLRVPDYLVGKALPLLLLLSLCTWVPALLLLVLKSATTASFEWLRQEPHLPFAIVAYSTLLILCLTSITLAVSSLTSSPRLASGQLVAVLLFPSAAGDILAALTHDDAWQLLSLNANLDQVCSWFFRRELPYELSPWATLAMLLALTAAGIAILLRRVRAVDVVGDS